MVDQFKFLFVLSILISSCDNIELIQPVKLGEIESTDCRYKFTVNEESIYGAWEPKQIIDLEEKDTVTYDLGKGHTGFILNDHYADSFELRPDSVIVLYYVESGRFCKNRMDGIWYLQEDTLYISRFINDLVKLPITKIETEELELFDIVNFKSSKVLYRKNNN